jgi:signal peptidase II
MKTKLILFLIIAVFIIVADQSVKRYYLRKYGLNAVHSLKNKRFKIYIVKNEGAFLGLGKKYPLIVLAISIILVGILFIYCLVSDEILLKNIMLIIMASGAISNIIDRVIRHGVIDYLSIQIGRKRIIANLADFFIFISAVLYLILNIFYK